MAQVVRPRADLVAAGWVLEDHVVLHHEARGANPLQVRLDLRTLARRGAFRTARDFERGSWWYHRDDVPRDVGDVPAVAEALLLLGAARGRGDDEEEE